MTGNKNSWSSGWKNKHTALTLGEGDTCIYGNTNHREEQMDELTVFKGGTTVWTDCAYPRKFHFRPALATTHEKHRVSTVEKQCSTVFSLFFKSVNSSMTSSLSQCQQLLRQFIFAVIFCGKCSKANVPRSRRSWLCRPWLPEQLRSM